MKKKHITLISKILTVLLVGSPMISHAKDVVQSSGTTEIEDKEELNGKNNLIVGSVDSHILGYRSAIYSSMNSRISNGVKDLIIGGGESQYKSN